MQSSYSTETTYPTTDDHLSGSEAWLLLAALSTLLASVALTLI